MMYILSSIGEKWKVLGITSAAVLKIHFSDGAVHFRQGINNVVEGLLDGDELFVSSLTKEELYIGKQLLYTLFKINK